MVHHTPQPPTVNGLFVRSVGDVKTISAWVGDTELIATISAEQAKTVQAALEHRNCALQIPGIVRAFTIPKISF